MTQLDTAQASHGRHLCINSVIQMGDVCINACTWVPSAVMTPQGHTWPILWHNTHETMP
jgi:hypothetical protein